MRCHEVMNRSIHVCHPDDAIAACAHVLRQKELPMMAVVDDSQQLVGLLSRRDALSATWRDRPISVRDVMAKSFVTCSPDRSVSAAAKLLVSSKAPALLIEEHGELVGWVSAAELSQGIRIKPTPLGTNRRGDRVA